MLTGWMQGTKIRAHMARQAHALAHIFSFLTYPPDPCQQKLSGF